MKRRGKADRFERVAKKELQSPWVMNEARLAMLLRLEHRAVVRMVQAVHLKYARSFSGTDAICMELIVRLKARAR